MWRTSFLRMGNLQITTMALGLGLAAVILYLVRRDHLYLPHGDPRRAPAAS